MNGIIGIVLNIINNHRIDPIVPFGPGLTVVLALVNTKVQLTPKDLFTVGRMNRQAVKGIVNDVGLPVNATINAS